MQKVKYFTRDTLILANRVAVATKRNRSLNEVPLMGLPDDLRFPIGWNMLHNDHEMRCMVTVATSPDGDNMAQVWIDIPFESYNALPEVEVPV